MAPIRASVPGDILTDLQRAGVTGDPYWNQTFQTAEYIAAWNSGCWSYTKQFATPAGQEGQEVLLVLDGVKMGAMIALNGHWLGNATDQFIRYVFEVGHLLQRRNGSVMNELNVTFGAELMVSTDGRYVESGKLLCSICMGGGCFQFPASVLLALWCAACSGRCYSPHRADRCPGWCVCFLSLQGTRTVHTSTGPHP